MKLLVTFRDTENKLENFTLKYKIRNCSLSKTWIELLIKNGFQTDHPIEKTFCLHGWQIDYESTRGRSLTYLCDILNRCINTINKNLGSVGYPNIDLFFSVDKLKNINLSRDLLNEIHHHFELLIGQVWNPSKWFGMADKDTRYAIRLLNNVCHEIEGNLSSIRNPKPNISVYYSLNCPNFDGKYIEKEKAELTLENYKDFLKESSWGSIMLYYSQLGKRHYEAFVDKDEYIDRENISGYRYITGEFILTFHDHKKHSKEFLHWLSRNDYDVTDKTLAIDYPILGNIETDLSKNEIKKELRLRDDLYKIELTDDSYNVLYSKEYNYTWKDQEII